MNLLKKSLSVFLCIFLVVSALSVGANAAAVYYDYEDGILYIGGDGVMSETYENDTSLEEVYIERGITSVPDNAFAGCVNLRKVTMSNTVLFLGTGAFSGCTSLIDVRFSDNIDRIDDNVFNGCTSLETIKLPELCEYIRTGAFSGCSSLKSIVITSALSSIRSGAFSDCTALTDVYYAGSQQDWNGVSKPSDVFNGCEVAFLSPVFEAVKSYSAGRLVVSVIYRGGNFNAIDAQMMPQGDADIYRIKIASGFTSTSNKNNGMISLAANNNILTVGREVFSVTYNVSDCENFSVPIRFLSCTVTAGGYSVSVPVQCDTEIITDTHETEGWSISSMPSLSADGEASKYCSKCKKTDTKILPFAFKECAENGSLIKNYSYGLTEELFRESNIVYENSSVAPSGTYVGTGSVVSADYSDGVVFDYTVALNGDVDGDGFCDAQDAIIMMCVTEGMLTADECTLYAADCQEDGTVDGADALYAQQKGINLI